MATKTWRGDGGSNLASTAACWTPTGVPAVSDDCVFPAATGNACNWDLAQVASIDTQNFDQDLVFVNDVTITGLYHNTTFKVSGGSKTITFNGVPFYTDHFVKIGSSATFNDVTKFTYSMDASSAAGEVLFDPGTYGNITLTAGNFSPQYLVPTVALATDVIMQKLTVNTGVIFAPGSAAPNDNDRAKVFEMQTDTNLVCTAVSFDGGQAKWIFLGSAVGYPLPVRGNVSNFGASNTFTSSFEHIEVKAGTAGHFCKMHGDARLVLNDLTINAGAAIKGPSQGGALILCVNRPTIKGTWAFTQIADGVYAHPKNTVVGVSNGGTGLTSLPTDRIPFGANMAPFGNSSNLTWDGSTFAINGKLTVTDGSVAFDITVFSSNTALDDTHCIAVGDTAGGTVTLTLPSASTCQGRVYYLKCKAGNPNNTIISPDGSETIDSASGNFTIQPGEAYTIVSGGSNDWIVISKGMA